VAAPFVEGRLWDRKLEVEVSTRCAQSGREMQIHLDDDLRWSVRESEASPLLFEPEIDWSLFREPTIVHAYCAHSVFFWSEREAREFRADRRPPAGMYLTLDQAAWSTRLAQGALFAFPE